MVNLSAPVLIKLMVVCFNEMFIEQTLPDFCKIAKVTALFKGESDIDFNIYRPISFFPTITKVFKKIIYRPMIKFLQKFKKLCPEQFGFRPKHSCVHASTRITEHMRTVLEQKDYGLSFFLDFKKTFVTVDQDILLIKLEKYGFRGKFLNLLQNYLTNRVQNVTDGTIKLSLEKISCGVPQGSVLSPLMFLIYFNNISIINEVTEISLFADDTAVVGCVKTPKFIKEFSKDVQSIKDWCNVNKLSIITDKSKLMAFGKDLSDSKKSIAGQTLQNMVSVKIWVSKWTKN